MVLGNPMILGVLHAVLVQVQGTTGVSTGGPLLSKYRLVCIFVVFILKISSFVVTLKLVPLSGV